MSKIKEIKEILDYGLISTKVIAKTHSVISDNTEKTDDTMRLIDLNDSGKVYIVKITESESA